MGKALTSIIFNIAIPSFILIFAEGTLGVLGLALAFPLGYGFYSLLTEKKFNVLSVVGIFGVIFTGGAGLLSLDNRWVILKEAGVPLIIGIIILFSQILNKPLIRSIFSEVLDLDRIDKEFIKKGRAGDFEEQLAYSSYFLAGAFFVSAILNYVLAKIILVSPPGSAEFNQELGKMTALSFPMIAVPMLIIVFFIMFYLASSIKKHTNLEIEDLIKK